MKKIKPSSRLTLTRETLRLLEAEEVRRVAGGATTITYEYDTCGCSGATNGSKGRTSGC